MFIYKIELAIFKYRICKKIEQSSHVHTIHTIKMGSSHSAAEEEIAALRRRIAELQREIAELHASSAAPPPAPLAPPPPAPLAPPPPAAPTPPAKGVILDRLLDLARTARPRAIELARINLAGTSFERTRCGNLLATRDIHKERDAVAARVVELEAAFAAAQSDHEGLTCNPPRYMSELESLRDKTDADLRASLCAFLNANTFLVKAIFGDDPHWYGSCTVPPGWVAVSLPPCGRLDIDLCLLVGGIIWKHTDTAWNFDSSRRRIVVAIATMLAITFSEEDTAALTTAIAFGK